MAKCTKAEKLERIFQIHNLLLDGISNYEIIHYVAQTWGLSKRQAFNYIKNANVLIEKAYQETSERKIAWHFLSRLKIYRKALSADNLALALQALKDMAELQGLYKHVGTPENPLQINLIGTGKDFGMEEEET